MLDFGWLAACGDDSLCARDSGRPTRAGCPGAVAACRRRRLGEVGRAARRFAAAYVRIFLTLPSRLTRPGGHLSGRPVRTSRAARQGSGATIPRARLAVGQAELHRVPGRAGPMVRPFRALIRVTRINPACRPHTRSAGGRQGRLPSECVYPRAPYMLAVAAAGSGSGPGRAELTGEADTAGKARLR